MFLADEIQTTIRAYKQALIPGNVNMKYLKSNELEHGICHFLRKNKLNILEEIVKNDESIKLYLCYTPTIIYAQNYTDEQFFNSVQIAHKTRIQYLENLLKSI